jgi:hypothetical protein
LAKYPLSTMWSGAIIHNKGILYCHVKGEVCVAVQTKSFSDISPMVVWDVNI